MAHSGKAVRSLLEKKGWDMVDLKNKLGVSLTRAYHIAQRENIGHTDVEKRVAEIFGMKRSAFVKHTESFE